MSKKKNKEKNNLCSNYDNRMNECLVPYLESYCKKGDGIMRGGGKNSRGLRCSWFNQNYLALNKSRKMENETYCH